MNEPIYSKGYELKDKAKDILTGYWGTCSLGILLVFLLLFSMLMVLSIPVSALQPKVGTTGLTAYIPGQIASYLANYVLQLVISAGKFGLCYIALRIFCRRHVSAADIFIGFQPEYRKSLILISTIRIVLGFLLMAPFDYMAGSAPLLQTALENPMKAGYLALAFILGYLLMVPIEIVVDLAYFLMLDFPEKTTSEILSGCLKVAKGHKMRFFILQMSFWPLSFLSYMSFGIGFLWLIPFSITTYALFYIELMQQRNNEAKEQY